jgi:hypothetical protein
VVNHFRTLLLNQTGSLAYSPDYIGEEYVPANYVAIQLPDWLQAIWTTLFGANPDRAMLNYRLKEYTSLLHSTPELADYVTAFDSRLTYWPSNNTDLFDTTVFRAVGIPLGSTTKEIYFVGDPLDLIVNNDQLYYEWDLLTIATNTVRISTITRPSATQDTVFTVADSLSSVVPLPTSSLSVRFPSGDGSMWKVKALARPVKTVSDISVALFNNNFVSTTKLFASTAEPYKSFKNMWDQGEILPIKLGGLLLALGYQINELNKVT